MLNRIPLTSVIPLCGMFLSAWLLSPSVVFAQDTAKVDFEKTIKPIFEQHCLKCHGEKEPESFRIDVAEDEAMSYIVTGEADESELYLALITDDEDELMPPADDENPLSKEQITAVKTWINQGAEWPAGMKFVLADKKVSADAGGSVVAAEGKAAAQDDNADKKPAAVDPKTQRLFNATGSLHPAAVHLPIGLLLAAGLFAMFSLRGNFVMSDCAYYCLWLGTFGAIIACVTGWWFSPMEHQGTVTAVEDLWNQKHPVFWHRTGGLGCTAFAFLLALFAASARNRDPDDGILWKMGLIVLALGIGWVGHEGGELTHGKHHYDALKAIGQDLLPSVFGDPIDVDAPAADKAPSLEKKTDDAPAPALDKDSEVGKTSDET